MEPTSNDIVHEGISLEDMCVHVFSKPPQPPFTNVIEAQLDPTDNITPEESGSFAFGMLQNVLFNGIAIAFPEYVDQKHLNLSMLTMENCELLKKYMRSFGYDICFDMIELTDEQIELARTNPYGAVKEIFKEPYSGESCKCGWIPSPKGTNKHLSDYYTHFIRSDNIGISLHFKNYQK